MSTGCNIQGGLSKEEVERLLRHGAYDIFNEDKVGESDAKSNDFVQQDIDTILQRHSQTIVHENTGSKSVAVGGTFSKASFKVKAPDSNSKNKGEDIDIEDPDFWKKMIGEAKPIDDDDVDMARRSRTRTNYSDNAYKKEFEASIRLDAGESSSDDSDYDHVKRTPEMKSDEASRAASNHLRYWKKDDVDTLLRLLSTYGYGNMPWADFLELSILTKVYTMDEVKLLPLRRDLKCSISTAISVAHSRSPVSIFRPSECAGRLSLRLYLNAQRKMANHS